jgi:hypothetical protein
MSKASNTGKRSIGFHHQRSIARVRDNPKGAPGFPASYPNPNPTKAPVPKTDGQTVKQ